MIERKQPKRRPCRHCKKSFQPDGREHFCAPCRKEKSALSAQRREKIQRMRAEASREVDAGLVYVPRLNGIQDVESGFGCMRAFVSRVKEE